MDAIECIKTRRSIRNFFIKPLPKEILEEIVHCARLAPTARNDQPWEFIIVTDKIMLLKIAEVCTYGPFIKDAAACIIVCGNAENRHLIEDGSAATENILLAANNYGIGSCWVAGWKREYGPQIKTILDIPPIEEIVSIIPLGYYKDVPEPIAKRELKDVIHWEKY
jgi:nitroreductase